MMCWLSWLAAPFVLLLVGDLLMMLAAKLKTPLSYKGKHCFITGGSKGIGLELARSLVASGAKVTLVARKQEAMDKAVAELQKDCTQATVMTAQADVTKYAEMQAAVTKAEAKFGPVDVLVCCAGLSVPGYFLDQDVSTFDYQMQVNYMGCVHAVKATLPQMITASTKKVVLFVSSGIVAGGFLGYASYAPTKFAVRALADSLRNELSGFKHVQVSVCYPPDTQTPGFDKENESKPPETLLITPPEVFPAKQVADGVLDGTARGDYHVAGPDIVQNLAIQAMSGISARSHPVIECLLTGPLFGLVQQGWRRFHADPIAAKYAAKKKQQ